MTLFTIKKHADHIFIDYKTIQQIPISIISLQAVLLMFIGVLYIVSFLHVPPDEAFCTVAVNILCDHHMEVLYISLCPFGGSFASS